MPVLLDEVVGALRPDRGGLFVNCTLGLGGHTRALLLAGATRVIPGSNKLADKLQWKHADTVPATMPAGSVVFYTCSLYHGAGAKWDAHSGIKSNHAQLSAQVDRPIAGLL